MAPITPDAVKAAWAGMKDWIEGSFQGAVVNSALRNQRFDIADIGLCNDLNMGSTGSTVWMNKGNSTLLLTELKITQFEGLGIRPAECAASGTTAQLPVGFSKIEVVGKYHIDSLCGCSSWGKELYSQTVSTHGSLTETVPSGTLIFTVSVGDRLTLKEVSIPGSPSVQLTNDSGAPAWLVTLGNILAGHDEEQTIMGAMVNVFATADFAHSMMETLNKRVAPG